MTFEILAHVLFRTYILWAIIDMRWKVVAAFKTVVLNFSFNRDSTCGFHYADTVSAYLLTIGRNCLSLFVYCTMRTLSQPIRWLCRHCISLFVDYADIVSAYSLTMRTLSQPIRWLCGHCLRIFFDFADTVSAYTDMVSAQLLTTRTPMGNFKSLSLTLQYMNSRVDQFRFLRILNCLMW